MISNVPFAWLVLIGVGAPAALFALLGGASLLNRRLPERWTGPLAAAAMIASSAALLAALGVYGVARTGTRLLSYGDWSS